VYDLELTGGVSVVDQIVDAVWARPSYRGEA
jgi:hypothetical protein